MIGIFRKRRALVMASVALAIVATGGPAAGTDGDVYPEGRTEPSTPCGSPVEGPPLRPGDAGQPVAASPAVRGVESSRLNMGEPRGGDSPCSIETLRKRAARARTS